MDIVHSVGIKAPRARFCAALATHDGQRVWAATGDRLLAIDPASGQVVASIPAPGHGSDSGRTWAEGSLWVGQYRDRKIHRIDPATGERQCRPLLRRRWFQWQGARGAAAEAGPMRRH